MAKEILELGSHQRHVRMFEELVMPVFADACAGAPLRWPSDQDVRGIVCPRSTRRRSPGAASRANRATKSSRGDLKTL